MRTERILGIRLRLCRGMLSFDFNNALINAPSLFNFTKFYPTAYKKFAYVPIGRRIRAFRCFIARWTRHGGLYVIVLTKICLNMLISSKSSISKLDLLEEAIRSWC
jgi:hypothetical protein